MKAIQISGLRQMQIVNVSEQELHADEVLVALSVLSKTDENCRKALDQLPRLRGCQAHATIMLSEVDRRIFAKLGINLTCDPVKKRTK